MESYVLGVIGIVISGLLYYLGYRQTIGAQKEKVKAANIDIEKILLKRIVLESYKPTTKDINRLIETKARESNLRIDDLYSDIQILNTLFTRIIETDFISPDKRNEIIEQIVLVIIKLEERPLEETRVEEIVSTERNRRTRILLSMLMGIFASLIGTFSVFWYDLFESEKVMLSTIILTVSLSFIVIIFFSFVYRLREPQEEKPTASSIRTALDFTREVDKTLKHLGIKIIESESPRGYDFLIDLQGKKIILEIKSWTRSMPPPILTKLIYNLRNVITTTKVDEAIIITKEPVNIPSAFLERQDVKIMTLKELRNYIVHTK